MGWFQLREGERITASRELVDLCGLPVDGQVHNLSDLMNRVPAEEREGIYKTLTTPLGAGSYVEIDFRLVRVDGEMLTVALRGEWLPTALGPQLMAVILERPSQEARRLTDLAERYRTLTELSPDVIVVHQNGIIVYANPATLSTLRAKDASEVVGHPILGFFTPASRAAFTQRVTAMEASQGVAAFYEEQVVALDGTVVDIEATSIPTQWDGQPAFQAIARVITERKAAHRQLHYQAALIDAVSDAIVVHEGPHPADLRITSWSRGAETIYGWLEAEVRGRRPGEIMLADQDSWDDIWQQVTASGVGLHETLHRRKDGTLLPVHLSATLLRNDAGEPAGMITVSTDISRRAEAEAARHELEEHYSAVVAALEEGVIVLGDDHKIHAANSAAERILGLSGDDLIGMTLKDGPWVAIREDGSVMPDQEWPPFRTLRTGEPISNAVIGLVRSGDTTWISINARPLQGFTPGPSAVVCSISDMTAAKVAQDHLTYAATHDALTGLPNRAGIAKFLFRLGRENDQLSALFVDIDHFKEINDSLGHSAGDQLLQVIARRISVGVREGSDIVGRLAGDEFVVICQNLRADQLANDLAERLLESIRQPVEVTDGGGVTHHVTVTASIGVAHVHPDRTAEDLLVDADVAMYSAKENGRSRIAVFDEALRRRARTRMEIREDLAAALDEGSLRLEYQPIVSRTSEIIGYESLVRWDHPIRGEIHPADFIPIAEENGLIIPLGAWVLDEAAATARRLWQSGRCLSVAVNLSAKQIADPGLLKLVARTLEKHNLDPKALCLEITESSVMRDADTAAVILAALKSIGVQIAIDDFGTGYSSLAYLDQFPVDALKIDRSFVSMLQVGKLTPTLIAGIISLGRSLNLAVIAEGVETVFQAGTLIALEVDALQGYLYGRPGPI
jgi:diguanylate cyclase (GGDEF)-like protein/PAS domain S-box-containing protein